MSNYQFSSILLVLVKEYFGPNPSYHIHYLGDVIGNNETNSHADIVNVIAVNAENKDGIMQAVTQDKELVLAALGKAADTDKPSLENQVQFIENIEKMLQEPVYEKQAPEALLEVVKNNMRKREITADNVQYLSGISALRN